jgi:predicted  nucleic acid-binding Zn-ribbon protein
MMDNSSDDIQTLKNTIALLKHQRDAYRNRHNRLRKSLSDSSAKARAFIEWSERRDAEAAAKTDEEKIAEMSKHPGWEWLIPSK